LRFQCCFYGDDVVRFHNTFFLDRYIRTLVCGCIAGVLIFVLHPIDYLHTDTFLQKDTPISSIFSLTPWSVDRKVKKSANAAVQGTDVLDLPGNGKRLLPPMLLDRSIDILSY